jgi:flavin reductase (DIM6/NTAB) family NADH-FMN oxidoreductase RutF
VPVDRETFIDIMASYPAGVAIVTTLDADGTPRGLTTTAVSSVSAEPPLLLVCVDRMSRTLPALRAGHFVVNFLREGRAELARLFASKRDDKFENVAWRRSASGMPILEDDALAWAECVTVHELTPGDHFVLLGQIEEGAGAASDEDAPLMYYRRSWGVWRPAPRAIERRQIPALEVSGQDLLWDGAEL